MERPAEIVGEAQLSRATLHGRLTAPQPESKPPVGRKPRWLWFGLLAVCLAAGALGAWRAATPSKPPEPTSLDDGRRVKDFALADTKGVLHSAGEWAGRPAVVLFFLGTECPASNAFAPEMKRLAEVYGPKGVAFYGLHPDPDVTAEAAAKHAADYSLRFPILLDHDQSVARQAGVRVTPEAVVLAPEGHVLYRGRIDDRVTPDGKHRDTPAARELMAALDAVLIDEMPTITRTRAFGCPLPPPDEVSVADEMPVTFNKHVAPILWKNCAGCHRPGEVGPFPLLTYKDAAKRAEFLRELTSSHRMPPWKPDPSHGVFVDDLRLSDKEIRTLGRWADAGAPEGDPADLPPMPKFADGWGLGEPDLVMKMPETYKVVDGSGDIYQAFVLPLPIERQRTVVAVEFRPGNRKVVHHARVFLDKGDEMKRRDDAEPGPGFRSWGGVDIQRPGLAEWIPGTTPRYWPEGTGKVLEPGTNLVLMIHYHPIGKPELDQSSIGLYFRETPPTRLMASVPLSTAKIDIPPGDKRHKISLVATMPADAHAYGLIPHGHFLMREIKLIAALPDGRNVPMLWINDWDFNWQGQYRYVKPMKLPKGTKLYLDAYYDNSADNPSNPHSPPRRVRFGPGSADEMLGCHVQVIADTPADFQVIKQKWPLGL
ncbi:MAG: redoxin family protein [Isosphaeraceae bacterium]|nr:redoxin family protein [Isosphaeraceae bacterium]